LILTDNRGITVCQVTSEPGLVARANLLDGAIRNDTCLEYSRGKVAASSNDDERTLWQFVSAGLSNNPKEEYLSLLGFHREAITSKLGQLKLRHGNADRLGALGRSVSIFNLSS